MPPTTSASTGIPSSSSCRTGRQPTARAGAARSGASTRCLPTASTSATTRASTWDHLMLVLNREDVVRLLDLSELPGALERAFVEYSQGRTSVPPRVAARAASGLLGAMPG